MTDLASDGLTPLMNSAYGPPFKKPKGEADRVLTNTQSSKGFYETVAEFERKIIVDALRECEGNQAAVGRLLCLKPTTLNSKIKRLGIDLKKYLPKSS